MEKILVGVAESQKLEYGTLLFQESYKTKWSFPKQGLEIMKQEVKRLSVERWVPISFKNPGPPPRNSILAHLPQPGQVLGDLTHIISLWLLQPWGISISILIMKTRKLRPESSCQKPQSRQADRGLTPNWAAPQSVLLTLPTSGSSSSSCTSESHEWLLQEPCPDSDLTCQDTERTGLNALLSGGSTGCSQD